jgi:hypothetical protein
MGEKRILTTGNGRGLMADFGQMNSGRRKR